MKRLSVVFDTPQRWHKWLIKLYLKRGFKVYVIEPFHAYHQKRGKIRFFPPPLPDYIYDMIRDERIGLLTAKDLKAKEINFMSCEGGVEAIEEVFPEYRKRHRCLIDFLCRALKSPVAENTFKKQLCNELAVFYSVNTILHRVERLLSPGPILAFPDINIVSYLHYRNLVMKSNVRAHSHSNIAFSSLLFMRGFSEHLKSNLLSMLKLFVITTGSGLSLLRRKGTPTVKRKKEYKYGVTIISPTRQLVGSKRGPDFIVDNKSIYNHEVLYLPIAKLNDDHKKELHKLNSDVLYPCSKWRNFSHPSSWFRLFWLSVRYECFRVEAAINIAYPALAEYFRWQRMLAQVRIKHFITYCDFGITHIARNLALKQNGTETWYFTDSMNFGINFKKTDNNANNRRPANTYLYYNNFITWSKLIAEYYSSHPESFKRYHVVGCLWAGLDAINTRDGLEKEKKRFNDKFIIAAYDSTYSKNSITSYDEGIAFAKDLLSLADECPDVAIIFKEKKNRADHVELDPILGPKLLALYDEMSTRPNVEVHRDYSDASTFMSIADLVISFPFTSTTFEALSVNKPALWHDPMCHYSNTVYGREGGVNTRAYDELKAKVLELKSMKPGRYQNPIPIDSPLIDPYRDRKAIERFINLLVTEEDGKDHNVR